MKYYSFVIWSPTGIDFPEYLLEIDPGVNAFNLMVEDVDTFQKTLRAEGIEIQRVHDLNDHGLPTPFLSLPSE